MVKKVKLNIDELKVQSCATSSKKIMSLKGLFLSLAIFLFFVFGLTLQTVSSNKVFAKPGKNLGLEPMSSIYIARYNNEYYKHSNSEADEWVGYVQLKGDFTYVDCITWQVTGENDGGVWRNLAYGNEISRIDQNCGEWIDMRCKVGIDRLGEVDIWTTNTIRLTGGGPACGEDVDPHFGTGQVVHYNRQALFLVGQP